MSLTQADCAKTAERIDILFGVEISGNSRNILLDGGRIHGGEGREFDAAFAKLQWPPVYHGYG